MRYLSIDLGGKRTGLAVGDDETGIVSPLGVVEHPLMAGESGKGNALLDALVRVVHEEEVGCVVVGLPLHMDGTEGAGAVGARAFGGLLGARVEADVVFQDERLTSVDADWTMAGSGLTHGQKKSRRDALAAAAILRDYLESV